MGTAIDSRKYNQGRWGVGLEGGENRDWKHRWEHNIGA